MEQKSRQSLDVEEESTGSEMEDESPKTPEKSQITSSLLIEGEVIHFAVGGDRIFSIRKDHLLKFPKTFLGKCFSQESAIPLKKTPDEKAYFLDMSPERFDIVMDFYRHGILPPLADLHFGKHTTHIWIQELTMLQLVDVDRYLSEYEEIIEPAELNFTDLMDQEREFVASHLMRAWKKSKNYEDVIYFHMKKFQWIARKGKIIFIDTQVCDVYELFCNNWFHEWFEQRCFDKNGLRVKITYDCYDLQTLLALEEHLKDGSVWPMDDAGDEIERVKDLLNARDSLLPKVEYKRIEFTICERTTPKK